MEDDIDLSENWQKFEEDKEMDTIKRSSEFASDEEIDEKPSPEHSSQDHFHEKVQSNQTSEFSNLSSVVDIEYRKTDLPGESDLLKPEVGSLLVESQQRTSVLDTEETHRESQEHKTPDENSRHS